MVYLVTETPSVNKSASSRVATEPIPALAVEPLAWQVGREYSASEIFSYLDWLTARVGVLHSADNLHRRTTIDQFWQAEGVGWGVGLSKTGVERLPAALYVAAVDGMEHVPKPEGAKALRKELWNRCFSPESRGKWLLDIGGWGETIGLRIPDQREKMIGMNRESGERWASLSLALYGAMGSHDSSFADNSMFDVVRQAKGAVEGIAQQLHDEFGSGTYDPSLTWRRLRAGVGHSMGAWVMANLIPRLQASMDLHDNNKTRWFFENPLVYSALSPLVEKDLHKFLRKSIYNKDHVQLLNHKLLGALIEKSPELLQNGSLMKASDIIPVVEAVVQYYLDHTSSDFGGWKHHGHVWAVKRDPIYIALCNILLSTAPSIINDEEQMMLLTQLAKEGRLGVAVGSSDRVLTSREQKRFAHALGVSFVETQMHSPRENQGVAIGEWLARSTDNP